MEIWKFPISDTGRTVVKAPAPAEPVHAGLDLMRTPCVWVKVIPGSRTVDLPLQFVATGQPLSGGEHVGTFQWLDGFWHVFTEPEGVAQ